MKIIITPSDLIERFIWDKYDSFCLDGKTTNEVNKIIAENKEFEISEDDAFVIGLTNVIYTSEVVYKFKQFAKYILETKSFESETKYYINKGIVIQSMNEFKKKIPKNWKSSDVSFNYELLKIDELITKYEKAINLLPSIMVQEWPCVKKGNVKKIINKL